MTQATVLVASPKASGSRPVASGSSVPPWPTLRASRSRRTRLTTSVDVMPDGLSMTSQPLTLRPLRRRTIVLLLRPLLPSFDILTNPLAIEEAVYSLRLIEGDVQPEVEPRRIAQLDRLRQTAAIEGRSATQGGQDLRTVLPGQRQHEGCRILDIWAGTHLGDGGARRPENRIVRGAVIQKPRQLMADQFTDPELALAWRLAFGTSHAWTLPRCSSATGTPPQSVRATSWIS